MSFTVYLGSFNKKINSTALPDYSGWHSIEAVWKKDKDLNNPVIELYLPDVDNPNNWNYMVIPSYEHMYWITGCVTLGNNRWQISGAIDPLATYRAAILATQSYIEYGKNTDASVAATRVKDVRQAISAVPTVVTQKADITGAAIGWTNGTYVLCAVGASGGVTAYALDSSGMRSLLNSIGRDISSGTSGDIEGVIKYFAEQALFQGSAISAIRSCTWLPLYYSLYTGTSQEVYLGDFRTGVTGKVVAQNQMHVVDTAVPIPWPVDDWRRMLCQIMVYVPFDGTVGIPVDQCNGAAALNIRWAVEMITGSISIRINAGEYTVHTGSGNIGVPYAIGSSNIPIQNVVSGALSVVGGAIQAGAGAISAAGGMIGGIMGNIGAGANAYAGGISTAVGGYQQAASGLMQALTPVVQGVGTMGGSAAVAQHSTLELTLNYYPPLDNDGFRALYGWPVMRVAAPVTGYCKTRGFSLNASARPQVLDMVSAAMDSGVFIE